MKKAIQLLTEAQSRIHAVSAERDSEESQSALMFAATSGGIHVSYHGSSADDEDFTALLEVVARDEVSPHLKTLAITGYDEGANGTRNWDFSSLITEQPRFSNLVSLYVEGTAPEHHNRSIIAETYDEDGQIACLLNFCPKLLRLSVPSAPNSEFFIGNNHPLTYLTVQAGYDTQNFVLNLSRSSRFDQLRVLDFTDYSETYDEDYKEKCTPFEHYRELFSSAYFRRVVVVILRNTLLSAEELAGLKSFKPNRLIVRMVSTGSYI